MLTSGEIAAISSDLPDLAAISESVLVPFRVRPLGEATVVWLNDRWFAEHGLLTHIDGALRQRVCNWILKSFAITAVDGQQRPSDTAQTTTAKADRYGSSSGTSQHGGSGRVATVDHFQIKGVGRTPLVGAEAPWIHAHGVAPMREAVYEAIMGEIFNAELPLGSVPVIAIVDAGATLQTEGEHTSLDRRALIVRPAVLRPGHMQRAALFVPASACIELGPGTDANRTYDVIRYVGSLSSETLAKLRLPLSLADCCKRLVTQAAYADALRLYSGGLFSSNVSLDGAVLDFGVGRAVDDWSRYQPHAHAAGFGQDVVRIARMAQTIQFYSRKAAAQETAWFADQVELTDLRAHYDAALREVFGRMWGDELVDERSQNLIRTATRTYFDAEQKMCRRERWNGRSGRAAPWIYDCLIDSRKGDPSLNSSAAGELMNAIREVLRNAWSSSPHFKAHCWRTAVRCFKPRTELNRVAIDQRVLSLTRSGAEPHMAERIGSLIADATGKARRWWFGVPRDISVTAQQLSHGCTALRGVSSTSGNESVWLEGIMSSGRFVWGDRILDSACIQAINPKIGGRRWCGAVNGRAECEVIGEFLHLDHCDVYRNPPEWW